MTVNGQISLATLVPVKNFTPLYAVVNTIIGSDRLTPAAAWQLGLWQDAYLAKFNKTLNVSEAYRPLARQTTLWQLYQAGQGNVAAPPGTSNHGLAEACDFGYPVDTLGTAERTWMGQTAAAYGWAFDVSSEAWHCHYIGNPTITTASSGTTTPLPKDDDMPLNDADLMRINQTIHDQVINVLRSSEGRDAIAAATVTALKAGALLYTPDDRQRDAATRTDLTNKVVNQVAAIQKKVGA